MEFTRGKKMVRLALNALENVSEGPCQKPDDEDAESCHSWSDDSLLDKNWAPDDTLSNSESEDERMLEICGNLLNPNEDTEITTTDPQLANSIHSSKEPLAVQDQVICSGDSVPMVDHEEEVQATVQSENDSLAAEGTADNNNTETSESITSPEKKRAKRGKSDPTQWKRNVNKQLRMEGKPYVGIRNETRNERKMEERGCSKRCEKKCKSRRCFDVSDPERKAIFDGFCRLDWNEKKIYVASLVEVGECKERKSTSDESRRNRSFKYHLKTEKGKLQVSKNMFLSTLGLWEQAVYEWVKNHDQNTGMPVQKEKRKVPSNRHEEERNFAKSFLDSLPKLHLTTVVHLHQRNT